MKCPTCENELTTKNVGEIAVGLCRGGCGGIWFDNYEFKKFDESYESAGEELLNIEVKEKLEVESHRKLGCPKCSDVVMSRHFFSIENHVEIDECPSCGGIWLDLGELRIIRNNFRALENKYEATKEYFKKIFAGDLAKLRKESEEENAKFRKFTNMFKYICPSYYIHSR
jgi:hypothetical protein